MHLGRPGPWVRLAGGISFLKNKQCSSPHADSGFRERFRHARPRMRGNINTLAMPGPTVAECTQAVGRIMFYCGCTRSSGVFGAFRTGFCKRFLEERRPPGANSHRSRPGRRRDQNSHILMAAGCVRTRSHTIDDFHMSLSTAPRRLRLFYVVVIYI